MKINDFKNTRSSKFEYLTYLLVPAKVCEFQPILIKNKMVKYSFINKSKSTDIYKYTQ